MDRYIVSFDRNLRDTAAFSKLLSRPKDSFVDGITHLSTKDDGLEPDVVLEYPSIAVVSATLSEAEVFSLKTNPLVSSIRKSRKVQGSPILSSSLFQAPPPETLAATAWHVSLVNADKCWAQTTGKGVKVGIIDSEIDPNLANLPIVDGRSFNPDAPDWRGTDDPHGTFCAAIIGCRNTNGSMVGIAPECDLFALRTNKNGQGTVDYLIAAMGWAAANKLDIVSMSQRDFTGADDPHEPYWEDLNRAAEECTKAGCIVVGIAGNSGAQSNPWVTNPGRCPQVIAVGGTRQDDSWWTSSSYGPDDLPQEEAVEIVAPGDHVFSIMPGGIFVPGSGTSFAAPQVAGACALLKQLRPDLTPAQLRTLLKTASRDLGPQGRDANLELAAWIAWQQSTLFLVCSALTEGAR